MSARQKKDDAAEENAIARNRKARFEYEILEKFEAGLHLVGSEVKSLRNRDASINEAYARPRGGELWLLNMNIKPYAQANVQNHEPLRPRKLLLHRREIKHFAHRAYEKGLTLVPLEMHFRRGLAKVVLGICRGKQRHDKREAMKTAQAKRDIQRQMSRRK